MKKRFIAIILALTLAVSFAACNQAPSSTPPPKSTSTNENSATATPSPIEEFDVDWYVNLSYWKYDTEGWGIDMVSKEIKEKTGANINFIVPASDGGEQLSTMIASDTLPDLITMANWWDTKSRMLTYQLSQEGYLYAYDDLIAEHRPSLKNVIRDDLFNYHQEKDGKTYLIPNFGYSSEDVEVGERLVPNICFTVRKDLLEQIGNPDISTMEGLLAACEKVKTEVKTYDGQDIIPIQMYEGASLSALTSYFAVPCEDESGNMISAFSHPNYKEALKFVNTAYNKGYISDSNFSDNRDMVNEKIASGRAFIMFTAPQDFIPSLQALYDKDPKAVYIPFEIRNSKGEEPVLSDIRGTGWLVTAMSKKSKNPEGIARLIEYLLSDEGQILAFYGKEGITFNYDADGKIVFTEEYTKALAANDIKKYGLNSMNLFQNYAFARKFETLPTDAKTLATGDVWIKDGMKKYSYDMMPADLLLDPSDPRRDKMSQISVKIKEYRKVAIAEIITAKSEAAADARYEKAIQDLKDLGSEELLAYENEGFQASKKAFNVKFAWPPYQK